MQRKPVGEGILPKINPQYAREFEDAFIVYLEFGEMTFVDYVSRQPPQVQEHIYNTFKLFGMIIERHFDEDVQGSP